jgi:Hpt domain
MIGGLVILVAGGVRDRADEHAGEVKSRRRNPRARASGARGRADRKSVRDGAAAAPAGPAEIEGIDAALGCRDRAKLAEAVHRLKNSTGMIGATRLAAAADELQAQMDADRANAETNGKLEVEALIRRWSATRAAIELELTRAD